MDMDKQRLEGLIIDYIDDRLNTVDRETVEQELRANIDARRLYDELKEVMRAIDESPLLDPPENLKRSFDNIISQELKGSRQAKTVLLHPAFYRVAAAVALLILGTGIGYWIHKYNTQQEGLRQLAHEMEVTRRQLDSTKQLMLGMLDNEQSASQRIRGLNVALELPKADKEIVDALFKTLHNDPNTNVRLAALDALARFHDDSDIRKQLIASLSTQRDPMVQIKLIQLMVQMKEKAVIDDLRNLVDDDATMKAVKDEAHSGILKLS